VAPTDTLAVDGYKLYRTDLGSGNFSVVYDGALNSERLHYNVTGLTTGTRHAFNVVSVNANGVSEPSLELLVIVCLRPDGFPRPTRVTSTRTSVTLGWTAPSDSGGCPLLEYQLFVDDGQGGSFQQIDSPTLAGRPYTLQHTVTHEGTADPIVQGAALTTGRPYRFKLVAVNEVGSVESTNYAEIVCAAVPDGPPNAPTQDFTYTDRDRVQVVYSALDAATNGGSAILGYDLWRDDGAGGDLVSLYGSQAASQSVLALTYTDFEVAEATTYRYQYRARNINGWGPFSGVAYLFAAARPATPSPPSLLSVSDTEISLQLFAPTSTGGSDITSYELWIDGGTLNSAFVQVTTYAGTPSSLAHTLTVSGDALTGGQLYSMKFRARNAVGYSEFSSLLRVGLGAEPPAISTLASVIADCGPTFVAMSWSAPTASLNLPVLGYVVQMISPVNDEWVDVLDASTDADRLAYVHYGAVTGETYTFRVFAVNFNGRSSQVGNYVQILACGLPRYMS
jgi:titin